MDASKWPKKFEALRAKERKAQEGKRAEGKSESWG
jgi:hypothetical protein